MANRATIEEDAEGDVIVRALLEDIEAEGGDGDPAPREVAVHVRLDSVGLRPAGAATDAAALCCSDGRPRLLVWADADREEPTHDIDLSGAATYGPSAIAAAPAAVGRVEVRPRGSFEILVPHPRAARFRRESGNRWVACEEERVGEAWCLAAADVLEMMAGEFLCELTSRIDYDMEVEEEDRRPRLRVEVDCKGGFDVDLLAQALGALAGFVDGGAIESERDPDERAGDFGSFVWPGGGGWVERLLGGEAKGG